MRLKIGDLAKRTGLSVRALHHYDAIDLLRPTQRSEGGARLYGYDDLIRLHRIEAMKRFGYSLAEIGESLAGKAGNDPVPLLQRQITEFREQALRAERLGRHLQHIVDIIIAGNETTSDDWLDTLELMNMYQKHLSDQEIDTLLESGADTISPNDPSWLKLIDEVRIAVMQAMPTGSDAAQDLAWRWIRLVTLMTKDDPTLANKLLTMQLGEPRAQKILGITTEMLGWIDEAFTYARCALFSRYLSKEQAAEVLRRQLLAANSRAWPALVIELKSHMEAGTDVGAVAVQAMIKRWQQLFLDSLCGEDAVLETRVRDALMREPDLQLGLGLDNALLAYLQKAHIAGYAAAPSDGGPKPSALMAATQRAAHQLLEQPLVFEDPVAISILGVHEAAALRNDIEKFRHPASLNMRSSIVVRSRLADDLWAQATERGIRQYVILGAGLDTSAYRHPNTPCRIFEADLPATQEWKRGRLHEAGIVAPSQLRFVPVDFEHVGLAEGLAQAGFDPNAPTLFSWLGVAMYLEKAAVIDTLRFIAGCAKGSEVLFEYVTPLSELPPIMRVAMEQFTAHLAERGEPWKSFFEPGALSEELSALGFSSSKTLSAEELNQGYLADRTDGLHIGITPVRLAFATV